VATSPNFGRPTPAESSPAPGGTFGDTLILGGGIIGLGWFLTRRRRATVTTAYSQLAARS
jgi:hypothetical protein